MRAHSILLCLSLALLPFAALADDGAVQLTYMGFSSPDWSPDGTEILFTGAGPGYGFAEGLWVISSAGGTETEITYPDHELYFERGSSWSPDGTEIAFVSHNSLYVLPSSGVSPPTEVYSGSVYPYHSYGAQSSDWSPVGSQIVFGYNEVQFPDHRSCSIGILTIASGSVEYFMHNPQCAFTPHPSWSPDGSQIAAGAPEFGIYVMPATGGPVTQITEGNRHRNPSWSPPDGSWIAFDSLGEIWVVPASGGTPVQITTEGGEDPTWSPDGSKIAFTSERGGSPNIWVIDQPPVSIDQESWGTIKAKFRE